MTDKITFQPASHAGTAPFRVPLCREQVTVLHADNSFIMIAKPSGLLSVPGRHPDNRDCAISRIQAQFPDALIVHRLDMDTSGLMVLARGADNHRHLSRQFQDRLVEKHYLAWVYGVVEQDSGLVELPLRCDWPNRPKQMVDFELGKNASTRFEVITRDETACKTLLKLFPVTGRSHQLRVHTAELGHPILGCNFYAHTQARLAAPRLQLHASFLQFAHPQTEATVSFHSAPDF